MESKPDNEVKRIYNLLNIPEDSNDKKGLSKKEKALNLLSYEIISYLANNGVKITNINEVLNHALEIPLNNKAKHVNKCFKYKAKSRSNSCCICGATKDLTIHHIKPIGDYPELKYRPDNTIICCKSCHEYIHNYSCKLNVLKEA